MNDTQERTGANAEATDTEAIRSETINFEPQEDLLVEEVSIDGMCGVY
ncbi:mycofactocin precursor MftA [Streptomyces sp. NBC_01361]|nr:mycofactocin precursor MftA [Streptomyces sp. NBC_01361]